MSFWNSALKLLRRTPEGKGRSHRRAYRARRRFRVEIINENTLSRLFSVKLSGMKAVLAAAGVIAAVVSLMAMIFMHLPWQLGGDLRGRYLDASLRIDSLERVVGEQDAYTKNLVAILTDSVDVREIENAPKQVADTLLEASAREQQFIRRFEDDERFNRSVLAPIAAEAMLFESPIENNAHIGEVSSIYRGTVISVATDKYGITTITIQHPNDFISVYGDLEHSYVDKGSKVVAGQRIGRCSLARPLDFELWHSGSLLDPTQYISY